MLLQVQNLEHCGLIQGWKRQAHAETFVNAHANQGYHYSTTHIMGLLIFNVVLCNI